MKHKGTSGYPAQTPTLYQIVRRVVNPVLLCLPKSCVILTPADNARAGARCLR